jgi:YfiH family protein
VNTESPISAKVRTIREKHEEEISALVHADWAAAFPWLLQGTTTRGAPGHEFDLGLFSEGTPPEAVQAHWRQLLTVTKMQVAIHSPQVHEADVQIYKTGKTSGLQIMEACDGHITSQIAVLLAVTTADCVPIFLVEPQARVVGVLHAGWRGVAAGILEQGLAAMFQEFGIREKQLHVHLGPAICGDCYQVGPEVFEALKLTVPSGPRPLDLRTVLADRGSALGVDLDRMSRSAHCTICTQSGLFSHRDGDRARHVAFVGIRA